MIDTANYSMQETLKNGLQVEVRAIRPDDRKALALAIDGLEEKTKYFRFFSPKQHFTDEELREATEVDFIRTVALVVCLKENSGERIIGAGRYIAFGPENPPDLAEVAFTVEEDFQGLGMASMLLRHLIRIGREKGIQEFHAEVLAENRGMLTVFNRCGLPVTQDFSDGIIHVAMSLEGLQP